MFLRREFKIISAQVSVADRFAPTYRSCLSPYQHSGTTIVLFLHFHDRHASSCLVAVPAFKVISLAERYSPRPSKVFVIVLKIISVTGRPTSSCFHVISLAGRLAASYFFTTPLFNIIFVAGHLAPSCCFVELSSRLVATLRVVLSALLSFK